MTPPPFQREIRSARYPHGLPDRCDDTVVEALDDAWLLLERTGSGYRSSAWSRTTSRPAHG